MGLYLIAVIAGLALCAMLLLLRQGAGATSGLGADPERPAAIKAMAARFRDGLDRNAVMAARAHRALVNRGPLGLADHTALMDQLYTFCQHSLVREDIFALADARTTLAQEFDGWLGFALIRHLETEVLDRAEAAGAGGEDAALDAHARRHGWLAPSTLALAGGGAAPRQTAAPRIAPGAASVAPRGGGALPELPPLMAATAAE